ncbi:ankyrin repeat and BTB/POZ domain-containing protein 2-like isoform X1 [Lates japonicus]|uniref:Ankyrin repeat and BTB/POZ domain-containing protein 2-like isoform X1 n=1 Tax=Lates japonicus TaxID=270547 RepID=A0AAD3ND60_LATJO|nr:ankyrin repeat and BTB/POZ domain-containing protein 2-like isoform X1 [Lates japonicus]
MLSDSPTAACPHISHMTYSTVLGETLTHCLLVLMGLRAGGNHDEGVFSLQMVFQSLWRQRTDYLTLRRSSLPVASFFSSEVCRGCEMKLSQSLTLDNAVNVYQAAKHHRATELCRFCEGFFLQNMDRLLDRDDFHRLLLGGVGQELLCPGTDAQDRDPPVLLRDLEAALIHRLYSLNSACQE